MTREASLRAFANVVLRVESYGQDLSGLTDGLPIDLDYAKRESNWVAWDDLMVMMERLESKLGSEQFGELVAAISQDPLSRKLRASLSFAVSRVQLYKLLVRWLGPALYPVHTARLSQQGPDRLVIHLQVPTTYRASDVFFRTTDSAFRYVPRVLGQPDSLVDADIKTHQATYRIYLPPANGLLSRIARVMELFTGARTAIETLGEQQAELQLSYRALSESYEALQEREKLLQAEVEERRRAEVALRHSEEQLLHSQRMEAMGRLAGGVAHDFNNLMTTVLGNTSMLQQRPEAQDQELGRGLQEIRGATERATRLSDQLLAFSRRQVLQPQVLDLNQIVRDLEPMLVRLMGNRIDLRLELAAHLPPIEADPSQIEQVLLNLAVNARDAMPEEGTLVLSSRAAPSSEGLVAAGGPAPGTPMVVLNVADTGTGIPVEHLPHIFEPFYTTKAVGHGTGLGLSTVYGIVRQSGGNIEVDSKGGEGTSFMVEFPASSQRLPDHALTGSPTQVQGGRERILVVEDEPSIRGLIQRVLEQAGYAVRYASNGDDGLATVTEGDFDLVISDVIMRGMSGPELAREIETRLPGTPVLLVSGYPGGPEEVNPQQVAFLAKPFTRETLLAKVREVLDAEGSPSSP